MKRPPAEENPNSKLQNPKSDCPHADAVRRMLDGPVSAEQAEAVTAHLEVCPACRGLLSDAPAHAAFEDDLRWADREYQTPGSIDVNVPLARLNELLDDYEVTREIGRGGMGIVYEARQLSLNRTVALKILPALLGVVRPDAIKRFRREAELAARLKHTNIIAVYDFGQVDGTLYYAMELIQGRSLREILNEINETGGIDVVIGGTPPIAVSSQPSAISQKEEASSPEASARQSEIRNPKSKIEMTRLGSASHTDKVYYRRVATWMSEVAEAAHYAHERGVIHRDVKPSNLLLASSGRLMISDFGLAKAAGVGASAAGESVTASRALLGTARYMSPEQVDESPDGIDRRVDVYGLGATLYELLAFRPMFAAADDREILNQVLNQEPTPPHRFVRQAPRELETICLKAVEKDRGRRYATAKDLADDLRRWLLDLPILAKRASLPARAQKFVRRRKLPTALGAALVVVLVAAGLLFAGYRTSHREKVEVQTLADSRAVQVLLFEAKAELFQKGRYAEALAKIDAALAIEPDSVTLIMTKAETLRHLKRQEEAVACMEEALRREPDAWKIHFHLARAYKDLKNDEKTAYHYREAERLDPDPAEALCVRATLEDDPPNAVELLTQALDLKPGDTSFLSDRSWRYYALEQYDAMLMDAQQLAGAHPNWAFVHASSGLALFNLGRFAEAERAFGRAIELDAEWPKVWSNRSATRVMRGRFAEAMADAGAAVRQDPGDALAFFNRARARRGLGDREEALADCGRAIRLDPTNVEFHRERGFLFGEMGRWQDSADAYTCAIQLAPDSVADYGSRGVAYLESQQYDRAIADFTKCSELAANDVRAYQSRAFAYTFSERFQEAVADYTRALVLDPKYAEGYNNRSHCLMRLGRYEEVANDLTQLLALRSNPADRVRRGRAYELAGDVAKAEADYAAAVTEPGPVGEYAKLWRYVLLRQTGREQAAVEVLSSHADGMAGNAWTDRVFDLLTGELAPADLLADAATEEERAEAHYYIGRRSLIDGDRDAARASFEECLALNRDGVLETDFARALLKQLDEHGPSQAAP